MSQPHENPDPNSIDDFANRFSALADEARSYGIASVYGMCEFDQFSKDETFEVGWRGGFTTAIGLLERSKSRMFQG